MLWGILLAVLSLMPGGQGEFLLFGIPHIDKIGHFGMYAVWAFLVFLAWKSNSNRSSTRVMWYTFLLGTLTGVFLEYGQYIMTLGRSFEFLDMVANGIGALLGSLTGTFFSRNKK